MLIKRRATAHWEGSGKEGKGIVTTQSKALRKKPYAFNTRFEDEKGTNPEELIGAAHAGCFSMKLAFVLNAAGFTAKSIDTTAVVSLTDEGITEIQLKTKVSADGLDKTKLKELATDAKENCPVSKLFKAKISLETKLV